jgi:phosphatidylglycerol:prolipoprotein diacylglycerol transferase
MYPKLFEIGGFPIHTYGLLLAVALLVSIELMARLAKREGLDRNQVWDLGFIIILAALLGAKLMLVVVDYDYYFSEPSRLISLEFLQAGGVYYGGLLGAVAGTLLYLWRHPELKFWTVADMAAPCIALGQAIGRLGCLAAGCDYGKPSDLPWAITFTSEYANRHVGVPLGVPMHPSQAYESLAAFLIFLLLLRFFRRPHFQGQVFLIYLLLYGVARFLLEFLRGDAARGLYFDGLLSTSQIVSLILVPLAVFLWWRRRPASQP